MNDRPGRLVSPHVTYDGRFRRWRRDLDDGPPRLPLAPGELSNGEFVPRPPTAGDRAVARSMYERSSEAAARAGIDRRRFLQGAGGMAASLAVLNACSSGGDAAGPSTSSGSVPPSTSGYVVPPPEEVAECERTLGDRGEFIFDLHTHHVMPGGPWREASPRIAEMILTLVPEGCAEADPMVCLDRAAYVEAMFLASDTTVALLSDVPNSGDGDAPVPFSEKRGTQEMVDALTEGGAGRLLVHDVIAPNFGSLEQRLDLMEATAATGDVAAFKAYPAWGPAGTGYALDDPAIGIPVVEQARSLGVNVFCAHKGLPLLEFDQRFNGPEDMVRLAKRYPQMDFVVFHSAFERETYEGPYDPASAERGVNSLIRAMDEVGVAANTNLWADLGTAWREVLGDPEQASHLLGKLLSRVGEDRVCWGTDAIWMGSPQPQIMAFRAFQIGRDHQEQFGYPPLTDAVKAKVLGLNAARLFGLDPEATRCAVTPGALTEARATYVGLVADGAVPEPWRPHGPVTRREVLRWLRTDPMARGPV
ncbi:MAG: amidohydrolase family protein [Acidimicrobiales bacterium]